MMNYKLTEQAERLVNDMDFMIAVKYIMVKMVIRLIIPITIIVVLLIIYLTRYQTTPFGSGIMSGVYKIDRWTGEVELLRGHNRTKLPTR